MESVEIWKDVRGYEGNYQVSNKGKVKSLERITNGCINKNLPEKILNGRVSNNGYDRVILYKDGRYKNKTIHSLVAIAFVPNVLGLPQINHIDGNKLNNNDWNLEWCTASQNCLHNHRVLGHKTHNKGLNNSTNQKAVIQVDKKTGQHLREFISARDASRFLGVKQSQPISSVARGNVSQKTAYGYKWIYKK